MNIQTAQIGQEVVRSKGDYVVGRIGNILAIDYDKNRVQVSWESYFPTTWVKVDCVELTSIPYKITEWYTNSKGKDINPKYLTI